MISRVKTRFSLASSEQLGLWFAAIAAIGFSLKAIFIKLAYPFGVEALPLLMLRMAMALPAFVWVAWYTRNGVPLVRGDWYRLSALGILGYYGASLLDFLGLQYISAGLERLILFTYPTLTILIAVLFQGRALGRREVAAMALCYAGIGFAFAHDLNWGETRDVVIGSAFVFASSLSFATYLSGSGGMIQRLGALRFTALAMLVSSAAATAHFLAVKSVATLVQPLPVYGYAFAMAVFATVVPVFAQSAAIRHIGAGRAALVGMTGPLLTIGFGWWWLGETVSMGQLLSAALVIAGVRQVSKR